MTPRRARTRVRAVLRVLADLAVPTALYYGLRAAGCSIYLTLLVSALVPTTVALVQWWRRRSIDGLALYMLTAMLLSTGVSLIAGSPRFLLAREGWLTGFTGMWFIASAPTARPLAFLYTRPLLERRTGPLGWDELWERLPRFRRLWRIGSVLWGVALLADSVVRVVMAYTLPVDTVPALGTALYVATSLALIVITNAYYITAGLYNRHSALYAPLDTVHR